VVAAACVPIMFWTRLRCEILLIIRFAYMGNKYGRIGRSVRMRRTASMQSARYYTNSREYQWDERECKIMSSNRFQTEFAQIRVHQISYVSKKANALPIECIKRKFRYSTPFRYVLLRNRNALAHVYILVHRNL